MQTRVTMMKQNAGAWAVSDEFAGCSAFTCHLLSIWRPRAPGEPDPAIVLLPGAPPCVATANLNVSRRPRTGF